MSGLRALAEQAPNQKIPRLKSLLQEQETDGDGREGIAVLHVLQKGGQLGFCGNRMFSGYFPCFQR